MKRSTGACMHASFRERKKERKITLQAQCAPQRKIKEVHALSTCTTMNSRPQESTLTKAVREDLHVGVLPSQTTTTYFAWL
jgi:hypothetical protein